MGRSPQPAAALLEVAVARGRARAAARPGARRDARELLHARRLRRVVGEEGERLHALLARARRHPGDDDDGLVRRLPPRRHRVLRRDGREELVAATADRRPVEPRRHARRRDVHARRRFRRGIPLGRAALLRATARVLRPLASGRCCGTSGRRGARQDLRHGRRVRAHVRPRQARPRRALARGAGVASRAHRADGVLPARRRCAPARGARRG